MSSVLLLVHGRRVVWCVGLCCGVGHIVAVDSVSPTVFCISETGELIRWFDCSDYMREPSDIAISGKEYFVCDFKVLCQLICLHESQTHSDASASQLSQVTISCCHSVPSVEILILFIAT